MPDMRSSPLYNRSHETDAALIEACGRVFAASLAREPNYSPAERDRVAAGSVSAFLDALAK
jgi:hypothetical protein